MILGRPTNLWLGLVTAVLAFAQVIIVTTLPQYDPVSVATILGALGGLLSVVISFVANQPPTVVSGSTVKVVTPDDTPNVTRVVT